MHKELLADLNGIINMPVPNIEDLEQVLLKHTIGTAEQVAEFDPRMSIEFDGLLADFEAAVERRANAVPRALPAGVSPPDPAPKVAVKSQRTTIRLPAGVINAFKEMGRAKGVKYQTLIIRALQATIATWPERPRLQQAAT